MPVSMRIRPTTLEVSNLLLADGANSVVPSSIVTNEGTESKILLTCNATGLTQFRPYRLVNNNSTAGYLGVIAEL